MTLVELAGHLRNEPDEELRWRYLREFLQEFLGTDPVERPDLIAAEPDAVNPQWDALLPAMAEHLSFHFDVPWPAWTDDPSRFLLAFWFPNGLPAARTAALETSPASFRRRGVFIVRHDLDAA